MAVIGATGCATATSDEGLADALRGPVLALEAALLENPATPDAVGEAGADVVVGFCTVARC